MVHPPNDTWTRGGAPILTPAITTMLGLVTGDSTIQRPTIGQAIIQAHQPTDTWPAGVTIRVPMNTGAGASWRAFLTVTRFGD